MNGSDRLNPLNQTAFSIEQDRIQTLILRFQYRIRAIRPTDWFFSGFVEIVRVFKAAFFASPIDTGIASDFSNSAKTTARRIPWLLAQCEPRTIRYQGGNVFTAGNHFVFAELQTRYSSHSGDDMHTVNSKSKCK